MLLTVDILADNIPLELRQIPAWCVWRYEPQGNHGGLSKPSYDANEPNERAWPNQPETWATFDEALACYWRYGGDWFDGIGIVLTEDLGITGVDLDKIDDWPDVARQIVDYLDSYAELSPSGNGYRVFCYATKPPGRCRRGPVEMFGSSRVFTVTGHRISERTGLEHRQDQIDGVHAEHLQVFA